MNGGRCISNEAILLIERKTTVKIFNIYLKALQLRKLPGVAKEMML
jgi:hypothetical protein